MCPEPDVYVCFVSDKKLTQETNMCALRFATRLKLGSNRMQDSALRVWGQTPQARLGSFGTPNTPCAVKLALALSKEAVGPMPRQVGGLGNSIKVLHVKNPATRNRTRDHLISATLYSQMLYQLSYSRLCPLIVAP